MQIGLTKFQDKCIDRTIKLLNEFSEPYSQDITQVEYGGEEVSDVCLSLSNNDVKVWIYSDEAQFRNGRDIDSRFELPDYDDENELMDKFIIALRKYLKTLRDKGDVSQ